MNPEFSIDELNMLHLSVIRSERILRENRIPHERNPSRATAMIAEANALRRLSLKVCAAKLSKELGFDIQPVSV